jgi:hypothetical protein
VNKATLAKTNNNNHKNNNTKRALVHVKRPNLHFGYEQQASYFPFTPNRGQKFKQVRMLMRLQNRMGISQRRDNVSVYRSHPQPYSETHFISLI